MYARKRAADSNPAWMSLRPRSAASKGISAAWSLYVNPKPTAPALTRATPMTRTGVTLLDGLGRPPGAAAC